MSPGVALDAERKPAQHSILGTSEEPVVGRRGGVQEWLDARLNLVATGIVAAAFLLRLRFAGRSFLNPDEALHYIILNQRSVYWAYKISLTNAHPPLIYLLVYYWKILGRSELMLRFPSVVAGTFACWFGYKWIRDTFGKAAGIIGLILLAFSPAMIALSVELRSYALLLCGETAALYFLECAIRERSVRKMWAFSVFLYVAILSHYSAIFFALALGIYGLIRIVKTRLPGEVVIAWAVGQAGALVIYGFLYVTHLSKLRSYFVAWAVGFDKGQSQLGQDSLFVFARERTRDVFTFLFENHYVAQGLVLVWLAAMIVLLLRGWVFRQRQREFPYLGILLLLPFVAVIGAAVGRYYPYVGDRHTVFLGPFVMAALAFSFAVLVRQKLLAAIVIAALLTCVSNTSGQMFDPYITKENQSRVLMKDAVTYIRRTVPQGGLILTDYQSALLAVYYLCGPELILPTGTFNRPASRVKCNGLTIASFQDWGMKAPFFLAQFEKVVRAQRVVPGEKVWVFQSGWDPTLARDLPLASPQLRCVKPEVFGDNVSVTPLVVGPDYSPAPLTDCSVPAALLPGT